MTEQIKPQDLPEHIQDTGKTPESATPAQLPEVSIHRQRIGFLGWKADKPDLRDKRLRAAPSMGAPDKFSFPVPSYPPIRDQGDQGSCTGHATRTAVQIKRALEQQSALELSPRFVYYNARVIEGTTSQDAGAEIRDVIKGAKRLGVAAESLCPYSDKVFIQRPTSSAYHEALSDIVNKYERVPQNQTSLKHVISMGNPVVFGFSVYENFMDDATAADGIMREPQGNIDGGHAACAVGYDDHFDFKWTKGGALIANSWGNQWGARGPNNELGYFWLPWALFTNSDFVDDIWAIDAVT